MPQKYSAEDNVKDNEENNSDSEKIKFKHPNFTEQRFRGKTRIP